MTSRTAAARYARALLDVALKESADLDHVAKELDEFVTLLKDQPALERVLVESGRARRTQNDRRGRDRELSGASVVVGKLLVLLAENDRIRLVPGDGERLSRHADDPAECRSR